MLFHATALRLESSSVISCISTLNWQNIEINPRYTNAWGNKGNPLANLRHDEAIETYDKSIGSSQASTFGAFQSFIVNSYKC